MSEAPAAEPEVRGSADGVWREIGSPLMPGTASGPLSGHTVAVKDLYAVAGFPLGAGVLGYLGDPRPSHAAAVSALLSAGADVTGIAHTDEFAYSITGSNGRYGMPTNPAAPQRIPGGSSSGSAVAVARGEVTIGLGTDTAGSIRVPAAYQGLWGIRTTHGSISTEGLLALAQSFDTVGWMTRDPETLAAVADCLISRADHSRQERDINSSPALLVVDPAICAVADPPLAALTLSIADVLGAERFSLNADLDAWFAAFRTVQAYEAWSNHGPWLTAHPNALNPEVAQRFTFAATVTLDAAERARLILAEVTMHLRAALAGRVLLLPTTATHPPLRDAPPAELEAGRTRTLHLTCPAAIAGLPAITVPTRGIAGLPAGLGFVGAPGTDHALIRVAREAAGSVMGHVSQ